MLIAINFKLKEIVFIEIKFRESSEYYSIFESITVRQQKRIFKSAEVFLSTIYPNYKDYKIRFDAYFVKNDFDFEYFKDAWRDY
jgi:Holliday junction resolvase-like predicted endonuclease